MYQLVLVLNPSTDEKGKQTVLADVNAWFKDKEGVKSEHLGIKDLAYEIADNKKGDFWQWNIEKEDGINFKEFNLYLNRNKDIIRYLILKVKKEVNK